MAYISSDQALANGWIVEYDSDGFLVYIDQSGNVISPETGAVINRSRGSVGQSAATDSWFDRISGLLTQGLSFAQALQQQKAFAEANRVRASQGLPPLSWSDFRPTASVGVTLDPKILWTILGVGALIAFSMWGRRK